MTDVLLFHHAHGLTSGVLALADELRQAGHRVHVPDLYEGQVFEELDSGVGYAQDIGFETIIERGELAAQDLPTELVYIGFSLGVLPAQKLAQTRPGAAGAILISACVPPDQFGGPWPENVPVQIHGMDADEFFVDEGDLDAARHLTSGVDRAELFLYPGSTHLFADESLAGFDLAAARQLKARILEFLGSPESTPADT